MNSCSEKSTLTYFFRLKFYPCVLRLGLGLGLGVGLGLGLGVRVRVRVRVRERTHSAEFIHFLKETNEQSFFSPLFCTDILICLVF